jgi:alkylation response protein AidB-like acyl-CoA dehydrogenase
MELELTVDQELFADTTRRFLDDKAGVDVVRALRDEPSGYDENYWRQGCELGWTSLLVAEDDGGGSVSGAGVRDLALVAYQFGRHAAPGPLIGCNVVAAALGRSGSPRQKDEVLGGLLAGEVVATWAVAEPRPHDGLGAITSAATPLPGGGWSLAGTKVQVESAATASHVLVAARAPDGPTQFLVPLDAPGVTVRPMQTVDLTRRFSSVTFDLEVGADAVVGDVGGAAADVAGQLRLANAVQCAEMVGALDAAMDMTLEWVMDRYSFGRPIGSYQAIKHRLADMKTWLEASHALADTAAAAVQHDTEGTDGNEAHADELCSAAKAYIGHHGPELCHECVQFHGGIGLTFEHDLHLYLRRVVLDATTYGTVADHRLRLTDILETRETQGAA